MTGDLLESALARIEAAKTAEELESVRVDVLGRKGVLSRLSCESNGPATTSRS